MTPPTTPDCNRDASASFAEPAGSASDEVIRMLFAFGDKERQDAVKKLAERVRRLEWFVRECRDDFDCDHDAHRYNTTCRTCAAAALMPNDKVSYHADNGGGAHGKDTNDK